MKDDDDDDENLLNAYTHTPTYIHICTYTEAYVSIYIACLHVTCKCVCKHIETIVYMYECTTLMIAHQECIMHIESLSSLLFSSYFSSLLTSLLTSCYLLLITSLLVD